MVERKKTVKGRSFIATGATTDTRHPASTNGRAEPIERSFWPEAAWLRSCLGRSVGCDLAAGLKFWKLILRD
uniref:Uncharacterized protein n=1 Tax=Panagrellus redivivus TaxID=6233 RepID=A0A7E4UTL1_PANRE